MLVDGQEFRFVMQMVDCSHAVAAGDDSTSVILNKLHFVDVGSRNCGEPDRAGVVEQWADNSSVE